MTRVDVHQHVNTAGPKPKNCGEQTAASDAGAKVDPPMANMHKATYVVVKYPGTALHYGLPSGNAAKPNVQVGIVNDEKPSATKQLASFCNAYMSKIFKKTPRFPAKARPGFRAQLLWCALSFLGAFSGLLIVALLHWLVLKQLNDKQATFYFSLMAYSFGASAVLLYDVPESPLAQPRNAIVGHVLAAFVGVTFRMFLFRWPFVCGPLSVAVAICVMRLAHATHPPGGASALLAAVATEIPTTAAAYLFVLLPVLSGSLILFVVAVAFNNCSRDRKYPLYWF